MIVCPFCGETDFDLIGLKLHLIRWCDDFSAVPTTAAEIRAADNAVKFDKSGQG